MVRLDQPGVISKLEQLDLMLGDKSSPVDLQAYFLQCNEKNREALYIPNCLVVVEAMGEKDDYFDCNRPDVLMGGEKFGIDGKLFIEGVGYAVKYGIYFPRAVKDFFEDIVFDYHYTDFAIQLLLRTRKRFLNF